MRKEMVDQKDGVSRLTVKVHMDDMKRVTIREQVPGTTLRLIYSMIWPDGPFQLYTLYNT
jgi:hypothetical protein